MLQQLRALRADLDRQINGRWWRAWSVLWSAAGGTLVLYRFDRGAHLMLGRGHAAARTALAPLLALARPWLGRCELHYRADIGPGLLILHPELGVVVSARARIGRNLILTGGNCIGSRPGTDVDGGIDIGDDVSLGANAVVLGPVRIGNRATIGAGAVVVDDVADDAVVVGVPARPVGAGAG